MKKRRVKTAETLPTKTGRENIYCAFYTGGECVALNDIYCAHGPCRFYKTSAQIQEEQTKTKQKLR